MTFKSLDKAVDWLNKHDPPDEIELDCKIKHRILYSDGSDSEWIEFNSNSELKNWIQDQYDQHEEVAIN